MIVKIITADSSIVGWKTLNKKIDSIEATLSTMKNVGNVQVMVALRPDLRPPVVSGRIPHSFMESLTKSYTRDGDAFVLFHMSNAQRESIGLQPSLRGLAFNDSNFYSEAYFWADEKTKRNRYNQFEETCLHEISHLMFHRSGRPDVTHQWHDDYGTIKGIFKHHDYREYQVGVVDRITSWLANKYGPSTLQPLVRRKAELVVKEMASLGHTVHVFEGFRSKARQDELYAQGRTTAGNVVTNAKGGESLHNYGVAVDIVFGPKGKPSWNPKEPWKLLGSVGKKYGFEWGGDWSKFTDLPHLEMTLGYKLKDFIDKKINYTKFR